MKIRQLHLTSPLNMPGAGSSKVWNVTGKDGFYRDTCKSMRLIDGGIVLELVGNGPNAGEYFVPWHRVDFVRLAKEAAEPIAGTIEQPNAADTLFDDDTTVITTKPQRNNKPAKR